MMKIRIETLPLLLAAAASMAQPSQAQRLLAIDSNSDIHEIREAGCVLLNSCTPSTPMPPCTLAHGGIAFGRDSRVTWTSNGPYLERSRPACNVLDAYAIPNLIGLLATTANSTWFNGLALKESEEMLFFVTDVAVGEVPTPTTTGGVLDPTMSVYVTPPYPLALPLTGVEYDPKDDTLWVIDSQYNIVNMTRPSAGGTLIVAYSLPMICAVPTPWIEGIALNPAKKVPGHPRGVLTISDSANVLYKIDRLGNLIGCCTVGPGPMPITGLAWKPKMPASAGQEE